MIDAACGGTIMKKSPEDAYFLIDEMAASSFQWHSLNQFANGKSEPVAICQAEVCSPLADQLALLSKQVETIMKVNEQILKASPPTECGYCASISHNSSQCPVGAHLAQQ